MNAIFSTFCYHRYTLHNAITVLKKVDIKYSNAPHIPGKLNPN